MTETTPNNLPLKKTHPRSGAIEPVVYVLVWQALSQHCLARDSLLTRSKADIRVALRITCSRGGKGKADQVPSIDT